MKIRITEGRPFVSCDTDGMAYCETHNRSYRHGDECGGCEREAIHKRATEFIQKVEKAHQDAANSTLVFGVEYSVTPDKTTNRPY